MSKKIDTLVREFGLNITEQKVFRVLNMAKHRTKNSFSVNEIQHEAKITTRTTLLYTLSKLIKRGLIGKIKKEKAYFYFVIIKSEIINKEKPLSYSDITEHIRNISKSKHFYGIQSASAIKFLIAKMNSNPVIFSKVHTTQKIRQVVIDSIIDEDGYKYVKEASFKNETKRGHFGRPTIISLVKKIPLPLFTEVMTDGTYVYLLNHSKSYYEIINSTVLASIYISLIDFLKIDSRKLNQTDLWL